MKEKEITKFDIWNIDETRFWIGCEKAPLVVTIDLNKSLSIIDPDNHNYITSVKCIDSVGKTIPPMLLVSGTNILYKWYHHNNLDRGTLIDTTKSGYTNNNTMLKWL